MYLTEQRHSIDSPVRWTVAGGPEPLVNGSAGRVDSMKRRIRTVAEVGTDAVILLLVVWLFPVAILVVGTPIALLARLVLEIARRF